MESDLSSEMDQCRIVVALCGLGRAGSIHFKGMRLNHRCKLKYIVEDEVEKAKRALSTYNMTGVKVLAGNDFHIVLEDKEVQAVIVATPTFTHESFCIQSLRAGKAVFCEKPIAEEIENSALCYKEAEKAGKILFCAFNRRFDPSITYIQAKVADGDLGKVHVIKTTSRDSPLPSVQYLKISGGMFHDTAVHDLDVICWMLNEEPVTVHAMGHAHAAFIEELQDVDTIIITMKFPSGVLSVTDLSRHSTYGYDQRIEVCVLYWLICIMCVCLLVIKCVCMCMLEMQRYTLWVYQYITSFVSPYSDILHDTV